MEYYVGALKKYAVFEGRATRSEFWYFVLFYYIVLIAFGIIDFTLFGLSYGILGTIYAVIFLIPNIAVGVRRLHDTGRSGWFQLVWYIPLSIYFANSLLGSSFPQLVLFPVGVIFLFGMILLLVYYVGDSQPGANQYGPNPKEGMPDPEAPVPPVTPAV
jgi:uncharacterized membrane protein YhaH (DUF805 family)